MFTGHAGCPIQIDSGNPGKEYLSTGRIDASKVIAREMQILSGAPCNYIIQSKTGLTIVALLRRRAEERRGPPSSSSDAFVAAGPIFHLCPGAAVTIFPRGRQSARAGAGAGAGGGAGKRERGKTDGPTRTDDGRCSFKSREN